MGKTRKIKNMKDFRNSRSRYYVNRDNLDVERPFIVVESATNNVVKRCETREMANSIARFQNKTPTFGQQNFPEFLKE